MIIYKNEEYVASYGGFIGHEAAFQYVRSLDDTAKSEDITVSFESYDEIREARKPLLLSADILINSAQDLGIDTHLLRQYRQALRDVTKQNFDFGQKFDPFPTLPTI